MSVSNNYPIIDPSLLLDFANVKSLDPRITFTRSTTATYYDGVTTAKAEENLLLRSQEFDNASWLGLDVTVTANTTTAPDGTSTADTLLETAATNRHRIRQAIGAAGTYTVSVFAKPNGRDFLCIAVDDGNTQFVVFNLATGTVGTSGGSPTNATITASTNGFYRCSVTLSGLTTVGPYFHIRDADSAPTSYAGDITKGVILWGAQLEQRSSVTAYTATTTQAITNYIPVLLTAASGVPRFDHNPTTDESLGLLVEEQRTNLLTYSSQLDVWGAPTRATLRANSVVSPDGTLNADQLVEDTTASNSHVIIGPSLGTLGAGTYTFSVYAKASGRTQFRLAQTITTTYYAEFDLNSLTVIGTAGGATGTITSVGNGWYRCTMTFTTVATISQTFVLYLMSGGTPTYTGDGFSGMFFWGAQAETGSFSTSYIPTVASTVTRNADAVSMTGTNFSSWYSAAEGTLYADFVITRTGSNDTSVAIIQGANTNDSIYIYAQPQSSRFRGDVFVAGAAQCALVYTAAGAPTSGTPYKTALAYKVNDFAMSINAATVSTDTSGTVPVVDRMAIGATAAVGVPLNGTIKKIAYYPLRVTNAQLQALTS